MTDPFGTFAELLGNLKPATDKLAFRYIDQNGQLVDSLSYDELLRRSTAVAKTLVDRSLTGQRVLLVYPPGLEFITAFLGCVISGTVAVPVSPPRRNRTRGFLISISDDCTPAAVLTTSGDNRDLWKSDYEKARATEGANHYIEHWLETDLAEPQQDYRESFYSMLDACAVQSESLAFIQYTSGSTSKPRGVMVSHKNLLANSKIINVAFGCTSEDSGVTWLPHYHDMGLIGGLLQTIYAQGTSTVLAPASFLQQPMRWLRTISEYRAKISGAPDFAYDLCARKATPEACEGLDLSCWKTAFSGAEMVRAETLDRFTAAFEPYGFSPEAFYPCYGLAEATLLVSGGSQENAPARCTIDQRKLAINQAIIVDDNASHSKTLISSGTQRPAQRFVIVHPETKQICNDREIGEVWVQGPSVSEGYYNQPEISDALFRATTADGQGPFLRTGDLAFIDEGELYITGRIKDLILIRGQNLYPDDIERTATNVDKSFRAGFCAAFTVEVNNQEQLVIAQEIEPRVRNLDHETAIFNIRQKVAAEHEVSVYAVVLLKAGDLPQTSSGKTQRFACRQKFLEDDWKPIATWKFDAASDQDSDAHEKPVPTPADVKEVISSSNTALPPAEEIQNWLIDRISSRLMLPSHRILPDSPFIDLGLSSLDAVEITSDLSRYLQRELSPTAIYQYPTISELAKQLATGNQLLALANPSAETANARSANATNSSPNVPAAKIATSAIRDERFGNEPIAIIGVGCRFPGGVVDLDSFWHLLENGIDAIGPVPVERWDNESHFDEDTLAPGTVGVQLGGFVEGVEDFDAEFFGISPREALRVDPQQRFLLETTWEALECAAIQPSKLAGTRTGVYVGAIYSDYFLRQLGTYEDMDLFNGTGNSLAITANRLSYFLGVNGPSMTIDTACSSSLVTTNLACTSLRSRESNLAIVAGVNLILGPEVTIVLTKAQMLSPDGRCKAFDASANGYARAEGCATIILKRLSDAVADGDRVLGVIAGSAVTHVGRSNGISAPNGPSQEMAMRDALRDASIQPEDVQYVEAHGTGTKLGDPIELEAIKNVYCRNVKRKDALYVGSVKTNIGHTESTAGLAGLLKGLLILQHQQIPPHLHLNEPNPILNLDDGKVKIVTDNFKDESINTVAVSSFGFGGTNTHLILRSAREYQTPVSKEQRSTPQLITVSGRSTSALHQRLVDLKEHLNAAANNLSLVDVAYTLNHGREAFEHRVALTVDSFSDLQQQLEDLITTKSSRTAQFGDCSDYQAPRIAFLFSGQGSQYAGMGKTLYECEPVFKDAIDECVALLQRCSTDARNLNGGIDYSIYGDSLLDIMFGIDSDKINETGFTQPCLFCFQYALTKLWESWGVKPYAVMGHSVGEFAAAVTAGVLSLEDGIRLISTRAALMHALPKQGKMVAVLHDEDVVRAKIAEFGNEVSIAALNGPTNIVISGRVDAVDRIVDDFKRQDSRCVDLATSHAFHSDLMEPMLEPLDRAAARCKFDCPKLPIASNLTGTLADDETFADPTYWSKHARGTVRFRENFLALCEQGCDIFIEIGPQPVLIGMANRIQTQSADLTWVPSVRRELDDENSMLQAVGKLYCSGVTIDFRPHGKLYGASPVTLPTYPFERQRHYGGVTLVDRLRDGRAQRDSVEGFSLLGKEVVLPIEQRIFEQNLNARKLSDAFTIKVGDDVLLSTEAALHTLLAASRRNVETESLVIQLDSVSIGEPLSVSNSPTALQTMLSVASSDQFHAMVVSPFENEATKKRFRHLCKSEVQAVAPSLEFVELKEMKDDLRQRFSSGDTTNPQFIFDANRVLLQGVIRSSVQDLSESHDERECRVLRALFGCVQTELNRIHPKTQWKLDRIQTLRVHQSLALAARCYVEIDCSRDNSATFRCWIEDRDENVVAEFIDGRMVCVRNDYFDRIVKPVPMEWYKTLNWIAAPLPSNQIAAKQVSILCIGNGTTLQDVGSQLTSAGANVRYLHASGADEAFRNELRLHLNSNPDIVVHCASLSTTVCEQRTFNAAMQTGYGTALDVIHELSAQVRSGRRKSSDIKLFIVTSNAQITMDSNRFKPADSQSNVHISQSFTIGLARVLRSEHPELNSHMVDLDAGQWSSSLAMLTSEVFAANDEDQICYRDDSRFVARLQSATITRANLESHQKVSGTALITGGLGGLGLQLARNLANQGVESLMLVGRSKPSEQALEVIHELRARGIQVETQSCDISQRDKVDALVSHIQETMAPLRRVYHLAGVLDDGLIRDQSLDRLTSVSASKAIGAWNLHESTKSLSIDAFVLFSSVAAIAGSPGQANYAAANAFLDSLAAYRVQQGLPATSVNWGSWADVGMAANLTAADHQRWLASGVGWIDVQRGMWAMEDILESGVTHCAVMPMDWGRFYSRWSEQRIPSWLREIAASVAVGDSSSSSNSPELLSLLNNTEPAEQFSVLLAHFTKIAAKTLAWKADEPPNTMRTLNELGFDSLTGVEFCNSVGKSVGMKLAPTVLFDYPTIKALSEHVAYDLLKIEKPTVEESPSKESLDPPQTVVAIESENAKAPKIDIEAFNAVEAMSEAELEALINGQLAFLEEA